MGYLIGGCINIFVILVAFMIFGSLPGVFWGFGVALLVIVILGIRSGLNKTTTTKSATSTPKADYLLEDEIRHHEYKNNDPLQGVQHHDNPSVSDIDEDEANR
jgi:hypothetical protein